MPRSNNSDSRSRTPRRGRRYNRESQDSDRAHRRKPRYQQPLKIDTRKTKYDIEVKSDIKNHVRYENVPAYNRRQEQDIMEQIANALRQSFGSIQHVTKVDSNKDSFSFVVGFKYDRDAYNLIKNQVQYNANGKLKLVAKPTAVFEQCIPMIRQAKKQLKNKNRSSSPSKHRNNHSTSSQKHKKKKQRSRQRQRQRRDSRSYQKNQRNQYKKKHQQKTIWIFGLPASIKGPEVVSYLEKHSAGPFNVIEWKWARIKDTNCEFMKVTLDSRKAEKLLSLRQQHTIQGSTCIIINSTDEQGAEAIKESLKQYQFKISFPQKINPASLYTSLNQNTKILQIVSVPRLENGHSETFIVTVGNASKAREIKRLSLRQSGIRVEDIKGQLVYRPTKHSKLSDN